MIRKVGFGADVLVEDELAVASMDADAYVWDFVRRVGEWLS